MQNLIHMVLVYTSMFVQVLEGHQHMLPKFTWQTNYVRKFWLGLKSGLDYNGIRYGLSFNYYCFQPGYHELTLEMLSYVCTCRN